MAEVGPLRRARPVLVLREGRWVLGWLLGWRQDAEGAWEGQAWWQGPLGYPGHGWVPAAALRPDDGRQWTPALPGSVSGRTR